MVPYRPWLLPPPLRLCLNRQSRSYIKSQFDPIIEPSSKDHYDLQSFFQYAERTGLNPATTYYRGTLYEYTVQASLRRLSFDLQRVGQKNDAGIDLIGTWKVPSHPYPLRVFVQCKNYNTAAGPVHIRELEGAFSSLPAAWRGTGVIGFLASKSRTSKSIRALLKNSKTPMGYIYVRPEGSIRQLNWNLAAQYNGLHGMHIAERYSQGLVDSTVNKECVLQWNGIILPHNRDDQGNIILNREQRRAILDAYKIRRKHTPILGEDRKNDDTEAKIRQEGTLEYQGQQLQTAKTWSDENVHNVSHLTKTKYSVFRKRSLGFKTNHQREKEWLLTKKNRKRTLLAQRRTFERRRKKYAIPVDRDGFLIHPIDL